VWLNACMHLHSHTGLYIFGDMTSHMISRGIYYICIWMYIYVCVCVCVCLCACLKVELEDENIHRQAREKLSRIYVFVTKDSMRNKVGSTKTWCRVHRECVQILFS